MPGARWFPDARLNFAENLLRRRHDGPALIFRDEAGEERSLSHRRLHDEVSRLAQALAACGVGPGDRVAGFLPNLPETAIAMLAAAARGAVWSSCSPDFGIKGVMDRFGQIAPKILFTADGYRYGGKRLDSLARAKAIAAQLPDLERLIVVPHLDPAPALDGLDAVPLAEFVAPYAAGDIDFVRLRFNDPLYILYSSGTTGVPKCIVHGIGGTLIKHLKEHRLHCDIKPGARVFYFTTCGWMMWNWLMSALASEATLVLYDGSPFHDDGAVLFDLADSARINVFGTSAKFIDACDKAGLEPARTHSLASVDTILSTGSPLRPEGFDYVYERVKADVCLASMSGGTDLIGCFVGGNPTGPVWRGEIQVPALGMKVEVFDDDGAPLDRRQGRAGVHGALPVDADRLLGRPRRRQVPRRLFRHLSQRLAARRLCRLHRAWRHGDLRPQRRGAQPRRRAHRHGRDLPRGGAARRGRRGPGDRPGVGRATPASCCSSSCAKASRSTMRSARASSGASARTRHRATCRRGSSRSPTSRARSAARSSSWRCATWSMAGPSRTSTPSPTPKRSTTSGTRPELGS